MAINNQQTSYQFGQMGSVFNDDGTLIQPPTGKVFVAIQFLEDTVLEAADGLVAANDVNTEFAGTEAFVVHGRLMWYDSGVKRIGDMTAAHRIQKKKGSSEYVDLGNDIKSANTDCMKKAFNMYMNIADDVYRNQVEDTELTEQQKDSILALAESISEETKNQIEKLIENGDLHALNYKGSFSKLSRQA